MTEVMTEADEMTDRGLMIEIEKDTSLRKPNPEAFVIQEDHLGAQTTIYLEEKVDHQDSEVNPGPLPGDSELLLGLLAEKMTAALV